MTQDPAARVEAMLRDGFALHGQLRLEAARALYEQALRLQPQNSRAWYLLGVIALQTRQPQPALDMIGRAIGLDPANAAAHNDHGRALSQLGRCESAVASYDKAIALAANKPEFHMNRGNALYELKRYEAAIASYDTAIAQKPGLAGGYYNRGIALHDLARYEAAVASFDEALSRNPAHARAHNQRGNALLELEQYPAALASFDAAIALQPDFADAHNNRGNALYELGRVDAALSSYETAIALEPHRAGVHFNRGQMLDELRQFPAAAASYEQVLTLKPDFKYAFGHRLLARMQICDWEDYDAQLAELAARIERGEAAANPFSVLALSGSAPLQKKAARIWVMDKAPPDGTLAFRPSRMERGKIRIGYFSADFCNHPVAYLTAEMYEMHDRSRFEVTAFSLGPNTQDAMRQRLERAFDQFIDVHAVSAAETAAIARRLDIDIAVDLTGFTKRCRPKIFALRAAPIQASYLGYLGTMGAPYIDYLIADATIIPPAHRSDYVEKLVYLPSYQANDGKREIAEKIFERQELGLPPTGFVFCCFNANYKITPAVFDSWMRILGRVPDAVLLMYAGSETAAGKLRKAAHDRGIGADRLVFAERLPTPDYLARFRTADLFLDTLPYNAGTTASDALWAGLPVLTCMGGTFAGRVAASLLQTIGLPELITSTADEYEELAVALANDAQRMAQIKHKLREQRLSAPLFNTPLHTRSLETAYIGMYARYQAGLPPGDIFV
jgi:predicted O-linked N-acetylglucosamine transferase (SPINDLY family)